MKVYGGGMILNGVQGRAIIAGTQRQAAEATGQSMHYISEYWCKTGNEAEIKIATENPGVLFFAEHHMGSYRRIEKSC